MGKFYQHLEPDLQTFIARQHLFFTGTAPHAGRVNISPKGMDTLRIVDERTVMYVDLTGSGNETAAHISQNGRLTLMFCSFDEQPLVLRIYGRGEIIARNNPEWVSLISQFPPLPGVRQIVRLRIESLQTSCGYGVPLYNYAGERETLRRWAEKKGEEGLRTYQSERNSISIDGLPTGIVVHD